MKRYDEQILHILVSKYEESLLYSERNRRNMSIAFPVRKSTLPEYFDESSNVYDAIHEQLMQLERMGYVRLVWKHGKTGHILEKCVLNTERLSDIYGYLRRNPKRERQNRIEEILRAYSGKNPVMERFCAYLMNRLESGESIKKYVSLDDEKGFERLCRMVCGILENQDELYLREFSVRHFQDTKLAEREIGRAVDVIRRFGGETPERSEELAELTADQILEEYAIYRNPSWVMLKGTGRFSVKGDVVNLRHFSGGVGIHSGDLREIRWKAEPEGEMRFETRPEMQLEMRPAEEPDVKRVMTIENLTTFHRMQEPDTLMLYLGGYHNRVKREFLMRLYEAYGKAEYLHFGDLDCGGFLIWKNLCRKTGIPFQTYRMDAGTLDAYRQYGRPLTEHDKKQLENMMRDPFFAGQRPVFARMLELGWKLEQEGVG